MGRALEATPSYPTYPALLSAKQYAAGLALPYAAQALMGKGGAVAILLQIFMAATSAFSSDLVCFASVWTFDVYRAYFNPNASGGLLIKLSHLSVILFALVCCGVAAGLTYTTVGVYFFHNYTPPVTNQFVGELYYYFYWDHLQSSIFPDLCYCSLEKTKHICGCWSPDTRTHHITRKLVGLGLFFVRFSMFAPHFVKPQILTSTAGNDRHDVNAIVSSGGPSHSPAFPVHLFNPHHVLNWSSKL